MKVLVADDEPLARDRLVNLLEQIPVPVEIVGLAGNGLDALKLCLSSFPDVVLLDIRMPVLDGIHCAREIARLPHPPAVIFVTAYDDYALQAFDVAACDYILKPVRRERLGEALGKAQRFGLSSWGRLEASMVGGPEGRERICAFKHGELQLIDIAQVFYFRAEQKYTAVRTGDGEVLIEDSLKNLEIEFGDRFMRLHRNTLVAMAHVDRLERVASGVVYLFMKGVAEPLEISRRCLPSVRDRLKQV